MIKYVQGVFSTRKRIDAKKILNGNGEEKCFLFQEKNLNR
jgi:hypothetical protein